MLLSAIIVALALPVKSFGQAPIISYSTPQIFGVHKPITPLTPTNTGAPVGAPGYGTTLNAIGSGFFLPAGLAGNGSGGVYVADMGNHAVKFIAANGVTTTTISSSFVAPIGVAFDPATSNLFVTDPALGTVSEFVGGTGSPVNIGSGFSQPVAVAVYKSNTVYVADMGPSGTLGNGVIYKIRLDTASQTVVASGFNSLTSVAVDASGNLYAGDNVGPGGLISSGIIYKIRAADNVPVQVALSPMPVQGITLDNLGDIFFTNSGGAMEIPKGSSTPIDLGLGFSSSFGVAVTNEGNLIVSDNAAGPVYKISLQGGYYPETVLPLGLSLDNTTGIISGTPFKTSAAQNYNIAAYTNGLGAVATLNISVVDSLPKISYHSPQTYSVGTAITPLVAFNKGAAVSTNLFNTTSPSSIGTGLPSGVGGIASDAAGNIYIADLSNSSIDEVTVANRAGTPTTIASASSPESVAVDAAGNIYYISNISEVDKIPAGTNTPTVVATGFFHINSLAVDPAGNIYVGSYGNSAIYKIATDGTQTTLKTSVSNPMVAVDGSGNIYYTTSFTNSALYEIPADGSGEKQLQTFSGSIASVTTDRMGNIYVMNGVSLYFIGANGGAMTLISSSFIGISISGVAVDGNFNIYVANHPVSQQISELNQTGGYFAIQPLPSGLALDNVTGIISGTPTTPSPLMPYSIYATNVNGSDTTSVSIQVGSQFTYTSPQTYVAGTAITPLSPTVSGTVATPGYSSTPVSIAHGFNSPLGVTLDAAGNIYLADKGNNEVKKIAKGTNYAVHIGNGFNAPAGVAVDASGNVYVADQGNGVVTEIPAGGGFLKQVGTGFISPSSVAIDKAGNIFVADEAAGKVFKINTSGVQSPLASGFTDISAIALDLNGNIYVADAGAGSVYRISANSSVYFPVGGTFSFPSGITVDNAGNVFVTDGNASQVYEIVGGRGHKKSISTLFSFPGGIAPDGAGNLYIADAGTNLLQKLSPSGGYFINQPLPAGLKLNDTTGVISGTPKKASPATDYTITTYFGANSSSSTVLNITVTTPAAPIISYVTPQTYTAGITITALTPTNTGGNVGGSGYNNPVPIGSGFFQAEGTAVDSHGNVYVADSGNQQVKEIPAGGGAPIILSGTFTDPVGIAVDSTGNVYVADPGAPAVWKIPAGGGAAVSIGSGFTAPVSVAVDKAGNVYVADGGVQTISEILATDGSTVQLQSGFFELTGVAVDPAGNLYIEDGGASAIYKVPVGGGLPVNVGLVFEFPTGIAVDGMGNVYVSDGDGNTVYKLPGGGEKQIAIASGFNTPGGIAVDGMGNLYIADTNNNQVDEVSPLGGYFVNKPMPAGLKFDRNTGVISGTPTAISPATDYLISAYNTGGSSSYTVNITVVLPAPPTISYTTPQNYTQGVAISALTPTSNGVDAPAYNSATITQLASGLFEPQQIATDTLGNIYFADPFNGVIQKIPAGGGAATQLGTALNNPIGVAVDRQGNVYVADTGFGQVEEILAGGGGQTTIANSFSAPGAVAVDTAGNVYVTDLGTGGVYKIIRSNGNIVPFAGGFGYPSSVAVDIAGNVYIVDSGSGFPPAVWKYPAVGGKAVKLGHNWTIPTAVTVDATGNVFVADPGAAVVKEFPAGGGNPITINGFGLPWGIAADRAGNLYVTDDADGTVKEIKPAGAYFIDSSLPAGLSLNTTTGIVSGTPTLVSPAKNYTVNAYNYGGNASAIVNIAVGLPPVPVISYFSPKVDTLGVQIAPLGPTTSTGVAASGYSSIPVALSPGYNIPTGVAFDAAGNMYVADAMNPSITKIPVGGGAPVSLGSGLNNAFGVAVDAAGNVYVADNGNNAIQKIPAAGGSPISIGSGFSAPTGVAVDKAGNVYVADGGNNAVEEILAAGGSMITLGSGFINPQSVAVDAAGNVYVSDNGHNAIKEIPVGGGAPITIATVFDPLGVAVDGNGNVFASSYSGFKAVEIPAGTSTAVVIGSNFAYPINIALDAKDNLYVADSGNGTIKEIMPIGGYTITPALPAGLSINSSTGVISGTPAIASVATDYTITAYDYSSTSTALTNIKVISSDATLSTFQISNGILSPAFAPATTTYTDQIANITSTITIFLKSTDPGSTITINGMPVTSGVRTAAIPMVLGDNILTTVVTASDGIATKTYTTTVTRLPSTNALFGTIALSPTTPLTGSTGSGDFNFTASVPYNTSTIQVVATAKDAHATITVNGTPVASGSPSQSIPLSVGTNTISTVITAQDGSTTKMAVIVVTRSAPSTNALLASIATTPVETLVGTTGPGYLNFTAGIPNSTSSIQVIPTAKDATATITVNGVAVTSGTASQSIPLPVGPTTITTVITAQDGSTSKTIIITANRAPSTDATLVNLVPSAGTLSPAFAGTTLTYSATVPYTTSSITLTPTNDEPNETIKVNGATVTSGTASASIPLNVGLNVITTVVTAQNGTTTKTYTTNITRTAASTNALLATISTTPVETLVGATGPGYLNFTANVPNTVNSIKVIPTAKDATATITVNGTPVTSGSASQAISLSVGATTITTVITAQDGVTSKTIIITVNRANVPTDALLASVTLSPAATLVSTTGPGYLNYTASVPFSETSVQAIPTADDPLATIKVNGVPVTSGSASQSITLPVGPTTITTVVTAEDGATTKSVIITVTRAGNSDASLSNLTAGGATLAPAFASTTHTYGATVPYTTGSITLTPTVNDPNATVKVNGTTVASGSASNAIALNVGLNNITTVVTAQNGTTTQTYTAAVTRTAPSTNALLASIKTTPVETLVGTTGPGYLNYNVSVPNSLASIQVVPTAKDATATITVNSQAVASGATSQAIALAVGPNTITTVITAQDGVTSKAIIITVTRAAPPSMYPVFMPISVTKPADNVTIDNDGIVVHQAISPNGDGVNDFLAIENITSYPENHITIVDRNGLLVYETKGYDNASKIFDGHSNINGKMQVAGTYFYSLSYTVNGETHSKTGFIILKY